MYIPNSKDWYGHSVIIAPDTYLEPQGNPYLELLRTKVLRTKVVIFCSKSGEHVRYILEKKNCSKRQIGRHQSR